MEGWAWMRGMGDGGGEHYRHEGGAVGWALGEGRWNE